MTLKPPDETFVQTDEELTELWRDMMGPGGFGQRSLWMLVLADDGAMCPSVNVIDDLPIVPDDQLVDTIVSVVAGLAEHGATVAFLLSRPGPRAMGPDDRRWARTLVGALGPLARWPIHLATYEQVRVFAPDDLIAA